MQDPLGNFVTKWGGVPVTSPAVAALQKIDRKRLIRGKNPLTAPQTQRAAMAAATRHPGLGSTPMPERDPRDLWSNAGRDIQELVKGIPQLPMALVNEAQQIMRPSTIQNARNPQQIGDFLELPGLRLLPGAFVGSALLPGGREPEEALIRPVSSALDLLPFAHYGLKGNAARALKKFNQPEYLNKQAAPYSRPGSYSSIETAQGALQNWPAFGGGAQMGVADRVGLQNALALAQGRRMIPDLFVRRTAPLDPGANLVERAGRQWLAQTDFGGRLLQFSSEVRGLNSLGKRIEADEIQKGRQTDAFLGGKALHERYIDEFGDTPEAAARWERISRAIQDPDSFDTPGLTPRDVLHQLDPAQRKYVVDYLDNTLPQLQEQLLADPDSALSISIDPYVARWDDGSIYLKDDIKRLDSAKHNVTDRVAKIDTRELTKVVDEAYPGLTQLVGRADAEALIRAEGPGWQQKLRTLREYEGVLNEVQKFQSGGVGTPWHKLNKGALETAGRHSYKTSGPIRRFTDQYRRAGGAVKSFERTKSRILPATMNRTGSRLIWEMYQENYKRAVVIQDELARLRPDLLEKFDQLKEMYREMDTPNKLNVKDRKAMAHQIAVTRGQLVAELGDSYRYLHYTTPRDPNWIPWEKEMQHQNMASLMTRQERNRLYTETRASLDDMRNNGYAPEYVPGVMQEKLADVDMTTVANTYKTPAFARERSFDYAPMTDDLGLSVSYAAMQDYLSRHAIPRMIEQINKQYGITGPELEAMLMAEARAAWGRRPDIHNMAGGFDEFQKQYINSMKDARGGRYVQFNPDELFPLNRSSLTAPIWDEIWLPKEMATVLQKSFADSTSYFQRMFEPITNTFRVSVLLFSPAWHWNNIMSNAFVSGLANPRAFLYMAEQLGWMGGWQGLKEAAGAQSLRRSGTATGDRGIGYFDEAMQESGFVGTTGAVENLAIDISRKKGINALNNNMSRAKTVTRVLDEIQKSKGAEVVTSAFHKVTQGSLSVNAFMDDLARRTNFRAFYEKKYKELADDVADGGKQLSAKEMQDISAEHALRQTQDWIMDWSQLLPVERGILRAVFPFYSFMSHIFRAALKFPFDHPLRVSIINAFTRAEIEDWQSRYPQIFRRLLGMPVGDDTDQWTAFNVDSFNPFRDIGNMLSFGFMASSTNPLISTALESMGIDTMSGAPEYAPNFVYDPLSPSGQTLESGNPIVNLAFNISPQAQALYQWMGFDADFREYEATDPDGARRALMSGLRFPTIWRSIDVNEQVAKDEIKRFNDYRKAVGSMDIDRVGRYDEDLASTLSVFAEAQAASPVLAKMSPSELAEFIVENRGGPPANPLSAFITV